MLKQKKCGLIEANFYFQKSGNGIVNFLPLTSNAASLWRLYQNCFGVSGNLPFVSTVSKSTKSTEENFKVTTFG